MHISRIPRPHLSLLASILIPLTAILIASCGAAPSGDHPAATVRDSAGIQIVESAEPRWQPGEGWRVDEAPRLTIGDDEDDPRYQLHQVVAALTLSDGRIVIGNGGSAQLRLYSATGEHLGDIGRRGEGPGEFQWIHEVWRAPGDSLMAFDPTVQRVSVFDPRGDFVRSFQPEVADGYGIPSIVGQLSDGTLVSIGARTLPVPAASGIVHESMFSNEPGIVDGAKWLFTRYGPTGAFLNELGEAQESRRWNHSISELPPSMYLPFSLGAPTFTIGGELLYLGEGTGFEIEAREDDGGLSTIIRWGGEPRAITRDDVVRYRTTTLEGILNENQRRVRERWLDEVPFPDEMPRYQGLLVDALGNLWVEEYRAPWEDQPRWWVFDQDGGWLGEVETPAGFVIREIGEDHLLATGRGEYDIEIVALFTLRR